MIVQKPASPQTVITRLAGRRLSKSVAAVQMRTRASRFSARSTTMDVMARERDASNLWQPICAYGIAARSTRQKGVEEETCPEEPEQSAEHDRLAKRLEHEFSTSACRSGDSETECGDPRKPRYGKGRQRISYAVQIDVLSDHEERDACYANSERGPQVSSAAFDGNLIAPMARPWRAALIDPVVGIDMAGSRVLFRAVDYPVVACDHGWPIESLEGPEGFACPILS